MRNLIPHIIQEQYQQRNYEGHFDALSMFVDVSGFTPMTQALMKEGHEGAEILAQILNLVFERMVNAVYKRGGFISAFAGDAFTAVFPCHRPIIGENDFAIHILACAEQIQAIFRKYGRQDTPFGQFILQVKVGISRGDVHWGIVGREEKAYFFRGDAIDACAASEHHADKGDIIFDTQFARLLPGISCETTALEHGYHRLANLPKTTIQQLPRLRLPRRPRLRKDIVSQFLPDAVINFRDLGEFRPVVPIFISFAGISTIRELDDWTYVVIKTIKAFGGNFNHLDFGDKGGVVICGFGAPVAYEDMIGRAVDFLHALRENVNDFEGLSQLKFRAGLTYGIAYAGIAGGQKRCEYTFYGEVVNLAARMMMRARWGEILMSEPIATSQEARKFLVGCQGDVSYKGITEPVPTYALFEPKTGSSTQRFRGTMIGRRVELRQLLDGLSPIFHSAFAGVAYIYGEAGLGKSRLAYALQEILHEQHDVHWFHCPVDQILQKPFNPFITFLTRYFDQWSERSESENKARFEDIYRELLERCKAYSSDASEQQDAHIKELLRTKSILGAQVGLFRKGSLWEQLDAKGKYENTLYAVKNFFLVHSLFKPVIIELEDGHWMDGDSLELLKVLTRNIEQSPLFIVSTLRYNDDGSKSTFKLDEIASLQINLRDLSHEDIRLCAESELQGPVSDELHALLIERTKGNPFYIQQIVLYFVENKIIDLQGTHWQLISDTFKLPDTINAILIARIDRLSQQVRELVKVAAVIGREFDVNLLSSVLKRDVVYQVKEVEQSQIWDELQELQYIFKHALIRDTAYQMQLRARLRELHRLTAETMESMYEDKLAERYADLAFHYEHAQIREKAIEYLHKAGDDAKAKYQNQQAIGFYERLCAQVHNIARFVTIEIDALLNKAEILELIGDWETCRQHCEDALQLALQNNDDKRMGYAKLTLEMLCRNTGKYDEAMTYFEQATQLFETVGEKVGIGHASRIMGLVYWQKSDYESALICYKKALNIYEELGDSPSISITANNIGILYTELKVDYEKAMVWYNKSLQTCKQLGIKPTMSKVLNNVGECHRRQGDYDKAMAHYEQTLQIANELGDKLQIATTLGNIGHIYKAQSKHDMALVMYDKSINSLRELGNKFFLSEYLIGKAENEFLMRDYPNAQISNKEGLQIAETKGIKDYIWLGRILEAKIASALGNEEAPNLLERMLQHAEDKEKAAPVHYEMWKMTHNEKHRQEALKLYQTLNSLAPNNDYSIRIKKMEANG